MTFLLRAKEDLAAFDEKSGDLPYLETDEDCHTPESLEKIGELIEAYPRIYPLLRQTTSAPHFDFQSEADGVPSESMQEFLHKRMTLLRSVARYISMRSESLLSRGENEKAFESVILLLKLSRRSITIR